ncbi:helix-turn-helix domain-containing protein [Stutzerimonas sp. KH-1]|jgi:transcriptional regulator with XRE-family HTH domain
MASADIRPGPLIRERRKALGITQPALAEQVGVNPTTLPRIEHGHNAGWTTIVALLQAVGAEVIVR